MWQEDPASVRPMLASTGEVTLEAGTFAYEPKYDGIRVIASVMPQTLHARKDGPAVRLWSRAGNEKTSQFPEVAGALHEWAARLDRPVVLDGEIVALDQHGDPAGFQQLQGRIHLKDASVMSRAGRTNTLHRRTDEAPIAFIAFDLLRDGDEDLRELPLRDRRARLDTLLADVRDTRLRLSEHIVGDGRALHARAIAKKWEGLIAKRLESVYRSGRRTPDWRKLKLVRHQTCVIGGWTDPRGSRPFLGALLLGVHDEAGHLEYVGHTGAGFTDAELGRVWKLLRALHTKACPFSPVPATNERPHWVQPKLVAEVKFTEWTTGGKLRHPTYLGLRDDVKPGDVGKETDLARPARTSRIRLASHSGPASPAIRDRAAERAPKSDVTKAAISNVLGQLDAIEDGSGNGVLQLPGGDRLDVTNLRKIFWPQPKLTKGDLFRHYVRVAPAILPALADRPLVMKRYPNGVSAKPFYQHRAADAVPPGVRVETIRSSQEARPHVIGGSLVSLLYTVQLASISQDPWFSRVGSQDVVDHVAIDLDPPDGLPFARVLDVARWVRDELASLGASGFGKTSGSTGFHIYIPMPAGTPYDAGLLFCQIVATMVASKHPKAATVERSVQARGRRVYVDFLQNIRGKTLASVYSARANDFAGISTPVTWKEVDEGVSPRDFTIESFQERLAKVGDLWAALRTSKPADLRAVMKYIEPSTAKSKPSTRKATKKAKVTKTKTG